MGWCYEFGTEIRAGCSHPMVASASACHCPDCGADCSGKFSGCSAVWDRGPIKITIGPAERNGRANGNGSRGPVLLSEPVATAATVPSAGAASGSLAELAPVLQAIWAELQVLTRRVDRLSDSVVGRDVATSNALKTTEELPDRIVTGLAAALSSQHRTIMSEVHQAIAESMPVTRGTEELDHLPDRLAAQLADLGDLFEEQIRDLSDRLNGLEARRPRRSRQVRETGE